MAGKQKSVYVTEDADETIAEHADRNGESYSWALRDLVRLGELRRWEVEHEGVRNG